MFHPSFYNSESLAVTVYNHFDWGQTKFIQNAPVKHRIANWQFLILARSSLILTLLNTNYLVKIIVNTDIAKSFNMYTLSSV